jgi:hypothetical protein
VTVSRESAATVRSDQIRAFIDALLPLIEAGLCRIVEGEGAPRDDRELALDGTAASACATTLATLRHLSLDASRARVAVHCPGRLGTRVARRLAEYGLRRCGDEDGLQSETDVLVVDGDYWASEADEAIRARVVVPLCATEMAAAAAARLHRRGVLVVPQALAAGGGLVAVDLWMRGLDRRDAVGRAFLAAEERMHALLQLAVKQNKPLVSIVGARARGAPRQ